MARYTTIALSEIIARTKFQLRLANTTEHDDYFQVMANEAIRSLDTPQLWVKKQCKLSIVDFKAKLPQGFQKMIGIRFFGPSVGDPSSFVDCSILMYVDKKFLNDCGCDISPDFIRNFNEGFQIVGDWIYINSQIEADELTIAYMGLNIDDKGEVFVYEDWERAIASYCSYMFTQSYPEYYPQHTVERYNRQWVNQRAKVKGEDQAYHFQLDKFTIGSIFDALAISRWVNA